MLWKLSAGLIYLALLIAMLVMLFRAREQYALDAQTRLDTPQNMEKWQAWRDKAKTQKDKGDGNVMRKVPKSNAPPTVVLLRDHFPMCVAGAILFGSLLYWVSALLLRGMFKKPTAPQPTS